MRREPISVSKGKDADKVSVNVLMDVPQDNTEFETFWTAHTDEDLSPEARALAVNRLAYQQYVVKAQSAGRGALDAKAEDKGRAKVQEKIDGYRYSPAGEGQGGSKTKKVAPAKVTKADLRNPKALLARLKAEGLLVEEDEDETDGAEG